MRLESLTEGVAIAAGAIRDNKLRSGLTILGVVIGVATVMAMASIVTGIRQQIVSTLEVTGPTTLRIIRFFSQTPLNPDALPREVRIRPVLKPEEAEALDALPQIHYAAMWTQVFQRLEYQGVRTQLASVFGTDHRFMEIAGGALQAGRLFTEAEENGGAPVAILEREAADRLFGRQSPLGRVVRVGGKPVRVVGVWERPLNFFEPPGAPKIQAILPFETARRSFWYDETNSLVIGVKPRPGVSVPQAIDAVTVQLRRMRGIRTGDPNTFDIITADQILGIFDRLTGAFFLVMIVLSSVALMVGGIGVMAIMMVSVTSRTRGIGVRKAMGATRRDVLWQFLVEAATLTGVGGAIGIALGLALGEVLKRLLGFQAGVPVWSAVVATSVSVGIGLFFGLFPANRAARLDPVEALRYE
ncbi:MAG: ABC transporter permease [Gemmatimonadetes bacterium]|nr:ABC transporter permease [Gemmatimonadota bacterium]